MTSEPVHCHWLYIEIIHSAASGLLFRNGEMAKNTPMFYHLNCFQLYKNMELACCCRENRTGSDRYQLPVSAKASGR